MSARRRGLSRPLPNQYQLPYHNSRPMADIDNGIVQNIMSVFNTNNTSTRYNTVSASIPNKNPEASRTRLQYRKQARRFGFCSFSNTCEIYICQIFMSLWAMISLGLLKSSISIVVLNILKSLSKVGPEATTPT